MCHDVSIKCWNTSFSYLNEHFVIGCMNRCVQYQCKNYLKVITCHIWDICWFDMFLTETSKNESTKMVVAEQLMTSIAKTQFSAIHIWFLPSHIKSYVFLKILILYFIFGFFSTSLTIFLLHVSTLPYSFFYEGI